MCTIMAMHATIPENKYLNYKNEYLEGALIVYQYHWNNDYYNQVL